MAKRRIPVVRTYHIRYVADFLVRATNTKEAYARGDEELVGMFEGVFEADEKIDDIFTITIESDNFHIVPEDSGEDDDADDEDIGDEEDDDLEDDDLEDDDESEDDDDGEDEDE